MLIIGEILSVLLMLLLWVEVLNIFDIRLKSLLSVGFTILDLLIVGGIDTDDADDSDDIECGCSITDVVAFVTEVSE